MKVYARKQFSLYEQILYSHILCSEHHRFFMADFLLIVLKDLLPRRPELKLILMSATLNADLFASFFGGAPTIHIPVSYKCSIYSNA